MLKFHLSTAARIGAAVALTSSLILPVSAATLTPLYLTGGTSASYTLYDLANAALFPNSADAGVTCTATTEDCAAEQLEAAVGTAGAQASFLGHAVAGTESSGQPPFNDATNLPGVWNPTPTGDIDYSSGDAPLSVQQVTTYDTIPLASGSTALSTYGNAVVAPIFIDPIAIPFNATGTGLPSGTTLNLSQAALCGIFTGTVINWDDPKIAASNPGVTFNNLPITVVVRSDANGAAFILSEALAADCPTFTSVTGGVGLSSGTNAAGTLAPIFGTNGGTFVQEKGSSAVAGEVNATNGSIGYVSVSYVAPFTPTGPPAAAVANKKGVFETPTVASSTLGIRGPYNTTGPSGTANGVTTTYPNPVTNQLLYISAPSNAAAYPIVGFTYGYFYQCSDATTTTTALVGKKGLFKTFILKPEIDGALTPADSIIESTGLVPLSNNVKANTAKLIDTGANKIVNGPVAGVCTVTS